MDACYLVQYLVMQFVFSNSVILGSVAELPADSCEDIKLSEDGKVASGTYWLDPARSGNISKVYCDMTGELIHPMSYKLRS